MKAMLKKLMTRPRIESRTAVCSRVFIEAIQEIWAPPSSRSAGSAKGSVGAKASAKAAAGVTRPAIKMR